MNLLLYVPFGLLGSMALEKAGGFWQRILWPVIGAGLLSLAIEIIQHALPARDPSLADWLLNIISAAVGTLIAALYSALPARPLSRRLQRLAIGPAPALLVALSWSHTPHPSYRGCGAGTVRGPTPDPGRGTGHGFYATRDRRASPLRPATLRVNGVPAGLHRLAGEWLMA